MRRQIPLDVYLNILRTSELPIDDDDEISAAFLTMRRSIAAFVDVCRTNKDEGYAFARDVLEEVTHLFPSPPRKDDNGAVIPLGGSLHAVDLLKATDDQLRAVADSSGMSYDTLKHMQAGARARKAEKDAKDADAVKLHGPFDNDPSNGKGITNWDAFEDQFKDGEA